MYPVSCGSALERVVIAPGYNIIDMINMHFLGNVNFFDWVLVSRLSLVVKFWTLLVTGPLDVSNCVATWIFGTNILQIFSKVEIFMRQQDQFGNLVSGLYAFDDQVVEICLYL